MILLVILSYSTTTPQDYPKSLNYIDFYPELIIMELSLKKLDKLYEKKNLQI